MFKPYAILCGAVSDALDALPAIPENVRARWLLEHALHQAEELYCEAEANEPEAQTTYNAHKVWPTQYMRRPKFLLL